MDLMYQEFSSKLKKSTQELAKDSDEKDQYSALIDARMAALREQNKEELLRIDKKLTQCKQELTEIELGKEIIGVDETVLDHLSIDQKSTDLKNQLNQQYHRASIVIGTSDSFWYQKNDHNYIRANSDTSFTRDSPASTLRKHSATDDTSSSQQSIASLSPSSPNDPSTSYATPIRKSSKLFESVLENETEEMNDPQEQDDDLDDDDAENDISPLTCQSNMKGLENHPSPKRLNFQLTTMAEEPDSVEDENSESDDDRWIRD